MTEPAPDAATSAWAARPSSTHSAGSGGSAYSPELADADVMQDISLDEEDKDDRADEARTPEPEPSETRTPEHERGSESPGERADVPSALPASPSVASPKTPARSRHSRNISTASAASALSTATAASGAASSVAFEEIGFDDGPGWTEAPDMALPQAARMGAGPPIAGGFSPIAGTTPLKSEGSPMSVRSEATVVGLGTPSKRSTAGTFSTLSGSASGSGSGGGRGLGLSVREADVPLVLGVAVVDFNHLVSSRKSSSLTDRLVPRLSSHTPPASPRRSMPTRSCHASSPSSRCRTARILARRTTRTL